MPTQEEDELVSLTYRKLSKLALPCITRRYSPLHGLTSSSCGVPWPLVLESLNVMIFFLKLTLVIRSDPGNSSKIKTIIS